LHIIQRLQLMNLMRFADEQEEGFCVAWLPDGKSFVIRQPDEFTRSVVPKYFKPTKFSSFTRKLYRWGFRQVNRGIGPDDPIIFGNEYFLRDNAEEMSKMRSITAASSRKAEAQTMVYGGGKRTLEVNEIGPDHHKRALLDHFLQQKVAAASFMTPSGANPVNMYGNFAAANPANQGGQVSLTNALRPSLGLGMGGTQGGPFSGGLPAMMSKHMEFMGQQQQQQQSQQYNPANNASRMNNFMSAPVMNGANQGPQQQQQQSQQGYSGGTSTADIVNAAISALRYAS